MSKVCMLVHAVISTHYREMTINPSHSKDLYRYINAIIKNRGSHPIAVNGIPNHIHIFFDLKPDVALSSMMREIKHSTSVWVKRSGFYPLFTRWSEGYFAASVSFIHKQSVIDYIKRQPEHHALARFEDEYERLILKNGLTLYKYPDEI